MKKLMLFLLTLLLSGCAYSGTIKQDFYKPPEISQNKTLLSIAIPETTKFKETKLSESAGGQTYTILFHPALIKAFYAELSTIFNSASIVQPHDKQDKYNILFYPSFKSEYLDGNAFVGVFKYRLTLSLLAVNAKTKDKIKEYSRTDDFVYDSNTPTVALLGILTGLSLFILSPITMPLAVQSTGNDITAGLENFLSKSITIIGEEIRDDPALLSIAREETTR